MAIKERKQITGTAAQIKKFAGHNGVLAYATDTKHLHVLSGTAGTTTELANRSDIPAPVDISGKADTAYVNAELAKKQAKGDYATTSALTSGLAGKANKSHTHTVSQITDMPKVVLSVNDVTPDVSGNVPVDVGAKTVEGRTPDGNGNVDLGLHAVATSGDYNDLANKPSMPATPKAYITETWKDGSNWYRKWSDGLIEQGGAFLAGSTYPTMTFNTPFSNTDYSISGWYGPDPWSNHHPVMLVVGYERKPESFKFCVGYDRKDNHTNVFSGGSTVYWSAVGY
nr:MAG TPA: tail repeat-like protein [Caudoviricetes sp.]